jgi:hypothetical protein
MILAPYGTAFTFSLPVVLVDDTNFADTGDYAYASGDIIISKDGGTPANIATTPTEVDFSGASVMLLEISMTAAEMQAEEIAGVIVDAALEHQSFVIHTYGHPSAKHPSMGVTLPSGQLSGTHAVGSCDLGTNAPSAISNGSLLYNVTKGQGRIVSGYTSGTGVVTWDDDLATAWDDDDVWYILPGGPGITTTEINAEVDTAITDAGLDHLVSASVTGTDIADNSIVAKLVSTSATADWDDYDNTTDALGGTQGRVNAALVALGLDHLLSTSVTGSDVANNSVFAKLVSSSATADWDDFVNTTDGLQAIRDFLTTLNSAVSGLNDLSAADVFQYTPTGTYQFQEVIRLMAAVLLGKVSGLPSAPAFRNLLDTKNVVTATTDDDGNRTTVTYDTTES